MPAISLLLHQNHHPGSLSVTTETATEPKFGHSLERQKEEAARELVLPPRGAPVQWESKPMRLRWCIYVWYSRRDTNAWPQARPLVITARLQVPANAIEIADPMRPGNATAAKPELSTQGRQPRHVSSAAPHVGPAPKAAIATLLPAAKRSSA